jgi:hypothetical protein
MWKFVQDKIMKSWDDDESSQENTPKFKTETWYDRYTRSWVTQIFDGDGNQYGESQYSGCKSERDFNKKMADRFCKEKNSILEDGTIFECINSDCGWKGKKSDCAKFKNDPDYLMCPECNDSVEENLSK